MTIKALSLYTYIQFIYFCTYMVHQVINVVFKVNKLSDFRVILCVFFSSKKISR